MLNMISSVPVTADGSDIPVTFNITVEDVRYDSHFMMMNTINAVDIGPTYLGLLQATYAEKSLWQVQLNIVTTV